MGGGYRRLAKDNEYTVSGIGQSVYFNDMMAGSVHLKIIDKK